jgi:hypothetical protein
MGKSCCVPEAAADAGATGQAAPGAAYPGGASGIGCVEGTSAKDLRRVVHITGGEFTMGSDAPEAVPGDGEGPARRVAVGDFSISPTTVTNREFAEFVRATRYVTDAERCGSSFVFYLQLPETVRQNARRVAAGLPWWLPVAYASWQRRRSGTHIHGRPDHPVVHVSWNGASPIAPGPAPACRPKRNGSSPRAVVSRADRFHGDRRSSSMARRAAMSARRVPERAADGWLRSLRPHCPTSRMAMASTACAETSGSGAATGSARPTTPRRRRWIRASCGRPAGARCAAVRSFVTIPTAIATAFLRGARHSQLRLQLRIPRRGLRRRSL